MEKEFANKSVLITGATSGIGKATVLRFAEAALASQPSAETNKLLTELQTRSSRRVRRCLAIAADLTQDKEPERVVSPRPWIILAASTFW